MGVVVEPTWIGANPGDRVDGADQAAGKIAAVGAVAARTVFAVYALAAVGERAVDRERVFWRLVRVGQQPVPGEVQRFSVGLGRCGSGAEPGAAVALLDTVVVAIPMQSHVRGLARALQP